MVRSTRKTPVWIALILALGLVAAACGGGDDDTTAGETPGPTSVEPGGDFSLQICEPEFLVPQNDNETCGGQVLQSLFTPLVQYDVETSEPANVVASDISTDDQTTWTITLNDGWTFHDGSPVNAQSFVDAWNWAANASNAAGNNYFFANIEGYDELNPTEGDADPEATLSGLEVVDDLTFTATLTAPFSQFALTVGYNAFYPLPPAFFEDPEGFNEQPIGNGPYMMDGVWEHDQFIKVTKFPDYAGTPGNADNIEFRIYSDPDVAYTDVQAGNLDIADVPDAQIEQGRTDFGDAFIETPSSVFQYIGFPLSDERFQSPELRQAFSLAIDREAVIEAVFFNTRTPARSLISPVVAGSREDACQYCTFDPELAAQKLEEAGGWEGPLKFWFNSDGGHETWVEAVSNMWRQNLGIQEIQFESSEFADYLGSLDAGDVDGPFRLGWVMDYPSPQNYLEPLHACEGSSNNTGYCNEEVDALIAEGNAAASIDEGIDSYLAAEDIILEDMPIIPTWFGLNQSVHSDRITNVQIDAFSFIRVADVQVVASE